MSEWDSELKRSIQKRDNRRVKFEEGDKTERERDDKKNKI